MDGQVRGRGGGKDIKREERKVKGKHIKEGRQVKGVQTGEGGQTGEGESDR